MNNIREKFDAWAKEHSRLKGLIWSEVYGYTYYEEKTAFEAWQAATEQSQKEIEALQAREKVLVDLLGECVDTVRNEYNEMLELYSIYPHKQYDIQCQKELLNGIEQALANVRGE
jgi:hypothetical protein